MGIFRRSLREALLPKAKEVGAGTAALMTAHPGYSTFRSPCSSPDQRQSQVARTLCAHPLDYLLISGQWRR